MPLLGVVIGILPYWLGILGVVSIAVFGGTEMMRLFQGSGGVEPAAFEETTTRWVNNLYQQANRNPQTAHSWNCRNCGGPNINRMDCEWCGKIGESK